MNQQNLDYLKDNLKYMGFGDRLYPDLEKNIQQRFPEFILKMDSEFNNKKMESILHFKRSEQTDMYFFNRHDAHIHHKNDPAKDVQQTFYINKGQGVTLKESFNLLEGRAVLKELTPREGEKYNAWIQLDFKAKEENGNYKVKQFHENYGYDMEAVLKNFPVKELMDEQQKERLMMSLQKGNVQSVTITVGGAEQKMFIEANPQFKTMNVYDGSMKILTKEQKADLTAKHDLSEKLNGQQVKPGQQPAKEKQEQKEHQSEKKSLKPAKKKEETLLPKKRTSNKKGISIS